MGKVADGWPMAMPPASSATSRPCPPDPDGRWSGRWCRARPAPEWISSRRRCARYCRPYVETFGLTPQSDVEIIRWADITETELYAPNVSAVSARLYALESLGLGDRLNSVEAAVTAPDTLRFPTRSDAIAATVPLTVDVVETQVINPSRTAAAACIAAPAPSLPTPASSKR